MGTAQAPRLVAFAGMERFGVCLVADALRAWIALDGSHRDAFLQGYEFALRHEGGHMAEKRGKWYEQGDAPKRRLAAVRRILNVLEVISEDDADAVLKSVSLMRGR